ncbi:lipoprotein [Phyllobacterium sp. 0TCS1.6C]|jgi:predicted small lipoprotein YifL|uniref:LPS translocon maturation chaperone LptM n=1 Tax=unclassified Phyllobacterium TaxID=2638441 RepID=UPI00226525C0|nr:MULTISPECIES: lipoprotein [unclassified Phyllobacterium]MCX8281557.1 lipoprotein [Phyllobacterium sp. 0TCS1.6C]MCX8292847.1 lipoprotein [Phyllobacterium sp. 0TCS1.6A]
MRRSLLTTVLMIAAIAGAVTACGRKGPLEAPPASVTTAPGEPKPAPQPVQDKRFILDPLI